MSVDQRKSRKHCDQRERQHALGKPLDAQAFVRLLRERMGALADFNRVLPELHPIEPRKLFFLAADTFWVGDLLNSWAENWMAYWTLNRGSFAMTDFEDVGVGQALQFLTQAGKANQNRLLVLRSAAAYSVQPVQPQGITPAQYLASENNGNYSGFQECLNDVYQVGSTVVRQLSTHWDQYQNNIPHFP